jgi:hypothetical protein
MEPHPPVNEAAASSWAHTLPDDVLALVFELVGPVEQCLAVGRLDRAWRRWAAPRRRELLAEWHEPWGADLQVPLWCLAEAWPRLSDRQRAWAAHRAAACGDLDRLRWLRARDPLRPRAEGADGGAATGGRLDVLRWLRAQDPPRPWGEQECVHAAAHGDLDVLGWLVRQDPPCPWIALPDGLFEECDEAVRSWAEEEPTPALSPRSPPSFGASPHPSPLPVCGIDAAAIAGVDERAAAGPAHDPSPAVGAARNPGLALPLWAAWSHRWPLF